jgi:hypothetical protein
MLRDLILHLPGRLKDRLRDGGASEEGLVSAHEGVFADWRTEMLGFLHVQPRWTLSGAMGPLAFS